MKKRFAIVVLMLAIGTLFTRCIKNTQYSPTTNPIMTADIGNYHFVAKNVTTATIDTQTNDSSITLILTGNTSDNLHPYDKIQLLINNYRGTAKVYSIVQAQAGAYYWHYTTYGQRKALALGGVIAITGATSNTISGYFSFDTDDTIHVANGAFTANIP